ncbi:hypothetical protein BHM03_00027358 [Ensete ventricosum]|nr:hypothetical protein BHM03_00027358 [Ensete ventricosum]
MATKFGLAGGIPERRVRPIWDAVDSRQYKAALKLATALLAKYPSSPYALVCNTDVYRSYWVVCNGRKKKREKRRGKTRENLEIRRCSLDLDPCPLASRRFMGRIFGGRGEKKMTFLLPTQGARSSHRGFTGSTGVPYRTKLSLICRYDTGMPDLDADYLNCLIPYL